MNAFWRPAPAIVKGTPLCLSGPVQGFADLATKAVERQSVHLIHDANMPAAETISFEDFLKVDIRLGTITEAELFPEARNPAFKLRIDFGSGVGIKRSAAQITDHYAPEALVGRKVMAVVNFSPRQIGPVRSEVLVLGFPDSEGAIVLAAPDLAAPNGARLA
nr:tRNA-binding protein [Maricaulis sp.]